jgi:hypothetical protein
MRSVHDAREGVNGLCGIDKRKAAGGDSMW